LRLELIQFDFPQEEREPRMQPIVDKLSSLIEKNGWKDKFEQTIAATHKLNISALVR